MDFLDIQTTIGCRFTLKSVRQIITTNSQHDKSCRCHVRDMILHSELFFLSLVSLMIRKFCFNIGDLLFPEEKRKSNLSLKVP